MQKQKLGSAGKNWKKDEWKLFLLQMCIILLYTLRQYYESKVLHATKKQILNVSPCSKTEEYKLLKNIVAPFMTLLLTPSDEKLPDYLVHSKLVYFREKWAIKNLVTSVDFSVLNYFRFIILMRPVVCIFTMYCKADRFFEKKCYSQFIRCSYLRGIWAFYNYLKIALDKTFVR